jgi:hypothetical protein
VFSKFRKLVTSITSVSKRKLRCIKIMGVKSYIFSTIAGSVQFQAAVQQNRKSSLQESV